MKYSGGALLTSITLDPAESKNLTTQLYMGIRDVILSGGINAGERLPASRTLAKELGVSRTTVINALDRLMSEGLLEAQQGAGTYVSDALNSERPVHMGAVDTEVASQPPRLSHATTYAVSNFAPRDLLNTEAVPFVTGSPDFEAFPMAQWAQLSARHWRGSRSDIMGYGNAQGLPELRRTIASHVNASRGIQCDPEQIFIVGGAQHAFQLIGNSLLNPGDRVWFENPGAVGGRNSFVACGADIVPVSVDEEGLSVESGLEQAPYFRLAFVTPSHQQPLSVVMSLRRRFALLNAAEHADAWIVEDDYDSEFYFGGQPLPTLKSVDTNGRVIYVGTFSKSLFPSLRVGFIISPPRLVSTFENLCRACLHGVPTSLQATIASFMGEGHFATHIRRMRQIYAERYHTLIESAKEDLAGMLTVQPTQSGLHTVGYFAEDVNELAIEAAARQQGIKVRSISGYCVTPIRQKGLVLGFGSVSPTSIRDGVRRLSKAFQSIS